MIKSTTHPTLTLPKTGRGLIGKQMSSLLLSDQWLPPYLGEGWGIPLTAYTPIMRAGQSPSLKHR